MDKKSKELRLGKRSVKDIAHRVNGRITDDAVLRVMMEEEDRIEYVFEEAKRLANHAGRETVTEEDVRLAYRYVRGRKGDNR